LKIVSFKDLIKVKDLKVLTTYVNKNLGKKVINRAITHFRYSFSHKKPPVGVRGVS
jgi:hypothetical protein